MITAGLTGGIGSGKTTVSRIFSTLGIPVFNADLAARRAMEDDPVLREQLERSFGKEIYTGNRLNNRQLGETVFKDPLLLEKLNALVHPVAIRLGEEWLQQQQAPYAIKEAALIFEAGSAMKLDYVIGVSAPRALRIRRAMLRDGITEEQVMLRMNRQIDEDIKMRLCDFVVFNDEQQLLLPQVIALHEKLLSTGNAENELTQRGLSHI